MVTGTHCAKIDQSRYHQPNDHDDVSRIYKDNSNTYNYINETEGIEFM